MLFSISLKLAAPFLCTTAWNPFEPTAGQPQSAEKRATWAKSKQAKQENKQTTFSTLIFRQLWQPYCELWTHRRAQEKEQHEQKQTKPHFQHQSRWTLRREWKGRELINPQNQVKVRCQDSRSLQIWSQFLRWLVGGGNKCVQII